MKNNDELIIEEFMNEIEKKGNENDKLFLTYSKFKCIELYKNFIQEFVKEINYRNKNGEDIKLDFEILEKMIGGENMKFYLYNICKNDNGKDKSNSDLGSFR